ncbi:hypothetical protein C0991_008825 [Blastosporella zonata]|nr:hypothetical protein C0991_008825 [Blastosporella zonata]
MTSTEGGSTDPLKNLHLAAILKRAKEMDVPKENIEKALAKAPVKFMFKRMGYITVSPVDDSAKQDGQDELAETALTNGAIDFDSVEKSEDSDVSFLWFTCEPDTLLSLTAAISQQLPQTWNVGVSEVRYMPLQESPEISTEDRDGLKALINELESNDDVLQVWTSSQDDR